MMPRWPPHCCRHRRPTNRDLLVTVLARLTEMGHTMTELTAAVADLKTSITDLAGRIAAGTGPLQAALAKAVQDLADFTAADNAEDADYQAQIDTLTANIGASLAEAQAAAADIQASTGDLNALAQPPVGPTV